MKDKMYFPSCRNKNQIWIAPSYKRTNIFTNPQLWKNKQQIYRGEKYFNAQRHGHFEGECTYTSYTYTAQFMWKNGPTFRKILKTNE